MWLSGQPGTQVKLASGSVPNSGSNGVRIFHVHIISGGTAGELKLYNGNNASGTLLAHLKCATVSAGNDFDFGAGGMYFPEGCWAQEVVDANISSVTYILDVEAPGELASTSSSCSSSSCSCSSSSCRSSSSSSRSSSSSSRSSSSSSRSSSSSSCRSSSSSANP